MVPNLRVLIVVDDLALGGAETYIGRIVPALRRHGVDAEVCALEPEGALRPAYEAAGIVVHATSYPMRASRSNTLTLLTTIREIASIARMGRFDIIHSYLYWADVLAAPAARLAGRRAIVSRRALHAWRHGPGFVLEALEAGSNLLAGELIANSRVVLRDTEHHERWLPRRRGVVYNGIDFEAISSVRPPARRAEPGRPVRLVTVGQNEPRKGIDIGIRALAEARAGGADVVLTIVGGGTQLEANRRLAAELGVGGAVTFVGPAEPVPHLLDAHLFLLPSRQEGFSNALLEAMAAGLGAVVTDVGGNAEAIVDGSGGRVVAPDDPAALARAMADLACDADAIAASGIANRIRVEQEFSLEASAAALNAWYRHR